MHGQEHWGMLNFSSKDLQGPVAQRLAKLKSSATVADANIKVFTWPKGTALCVRNGVLTESRFTLKSAYFYKL